jgi:hypothetical protein
MAKLIKERAGNRYIENSKEWQIGNRFKLTVYLGEKLCSFFIDDNTNKIHSLKLTPKIGEDLGLFEEPQIKLFPSIDTCSIAVPAERHDEIFKLIENYLLNLERIEKT